MQNYNRRRKRAKQSTWPSSVGGFSCEDPIQMAASNSQTLDIPGDGQRLLFKSTGKKMHTSQVHSKVTVLNKDTKNYLTLSGS